MTFAFVSCQHFAEGHFTPYADVAADPFIETVIFLGDYIYEGGANVVRAHAPAREIRTLDDYRIRHGQYKTDPHLQAAHAAHPWLVTWDDHEFKNNYADEDLDPDVPVETVRARRAAAYRAYWEHMPLARSRMPVGPDLQLYRRFHWGQLLAFNVLDGRQYRSDQPALCTVAQRDPASGYCPEDINPARTMLGAEQREWLLSELASSKARWNVLAQQTGFSPFNRSIVPGAPNYATTSPTDSWDGYVAERQRILDWMVERRTENPVVLTGDTHQHWVRNVPGDYRDLASPPVATELLGTSVSTGGNPTETGSSATATIRTTRTSCSATTTAATCAAPSRRSAGLPSTGRSRRSPHPWPDLDAGDRRDRERHAPALSWCVRPAWCMRSARMATPRRASARQAPEARRRSRRGSPAPTRRLRRRLRPCCRGRCRRSRSRCGLTGRGPCR